MSLALLAQDRERWPLAGDQLYIDLDLSDDNLPPGSQIAIGTAILEVTAEPHTGCKKFASRYGERCHTVCELTRGQAIALARHQRADRAVGPRSHWRHSNENQSLAGELRLAGNSGA